MLSQMNVTAPTSPPVQQNLMNSASGEQDIGISLHSNAYALVKLMENDYYFLKKKQKCKWC